MTLEMRTYLGVLLLLFNNVYCDLIPYGEGYGDSFIPFADDPVAMVLRAPFALFNERYDEFYISPHGAVSFETPLNGFDDLENKNVIAPYYLEATAGNIYWRMDYANSELDRNITRKMRKGFDLRDFRATEFILVTWEDIAGAGSNGLNTFQLGLATDGSQSYAIFTYSKLDYAYSGGKFAQIGFWGRGQDTVYGFNSGTEAARTLNGLGFLGEKGLYVYYTVGKPELGQKEEEEYDYKEMEKEYDELSDEEEDVEQPKDCPPDPYGENCPAHCSRPVDSRGCRLCVCADPSGPRYSPNGYQPAVTNQNTPSGGALTCSPTPAAEHEQCHNDARCESYGPGYCCKCAEGFLGNGKQCFAKSTAVRVNGNLEGAVNGNEIEKTEFYVYITPDAGQQHTTIPRVSSTLGYSMQFLDGIANINDWLFAKVESHNALNGIQLTGGKLNVTSTVLIGDKTQLFIKQFYRPKPQSSDLEVDVTVSGTIPDLPYGATIEFTDFDAKYTKSEAGRLRSYADRHVAVTADSVESQYRVTVDTQIKYDECSFATSSAVFMVHTDRISGVFEAKDETLRFGSQSVVYNEEDSANANSKRRNPCSGNHLCTEPHMECVSEEGNFRCQCQSGYQHEHDSSVQVQFRCVDRNECLQPGICDRNANCENSEGSYTCTCRQGFIGNGRSCRPEGEAGPEAPAGSTACTEHSQCHQWGECVFGQNGQPAYCKCRGWYVGDGVNHCGPPEPQNNENDVDRCGGHVCHEHAECRQNEQGQDICVCRNGYHGNGVHCIPLQHEEQHRHVDSTAAVCRNDAECSENAQCVYNAHSRYYRCECRPPFSGDGTTCVLDQNRPAPQTCESSLGCHRHAICVATGQREPAARCQCTQGFEGNGTWCVDYDEYRRLYGQGASPDRAAHQVPQEPPRTVAKKACSDQSECHRFGRCIIVDNNDPTFYCACADGYRGDGFESCVQVDNECDPRNDYSCNANAQCRLVHNNEAHAYLCECNPGYIKHGEHCVPEHTPVIPQQPLDFEEPPAAPTATQCSQCHSQSYCHRNPDGVNYVCVCNAGYIGDGKRCDKARTCVEDRNLCGPNAQCVPDARGQYVCGCNYGYHGNGYVCNPVNEDEPGSLLIARGMSILERESGEHSVGRQLVVVPHQVVVDIEFDCVTQRIFWSDIGGATIKSAWVNGTDVQTVFKADLKSPEGVAIDWTARNIYYADSMKDEIGIITLDGKYQKTLITEGLVNPRALAIDLERRHLYYSDWYRQRPHIGRLNLDGTDHRPDFIRDDISLPNGLTVLSKRRELCFVDAGKQILACTNLEGQNRRVVYAPLEYPFGLTHDNEETFYWTDWKDHQIHSIDVYGNNKRSFIPSAAGKGKLYGIHNLNVHCQGKANECTNLQNKENCHICIPTQHGATCACPDNVKDVQC